MKTYYVSYVKTDGDNCTVLTKASSKEDAKARVAQQYTDIERVISAYSKY